jgi:hypothetical protein
MPVFFYIIITHKPCDVDPMPVAAEGAFANEKWLERGGWLTKALVSQI